MTFQLKNPSAVLKRLNSTTEKTELKNDISDNVNQTILSTQKCKNISAKCYVDNSTNIQDIHKTQDGFQTLLNNTSNQKKESSISKTKSNTFKKKNLLHSHTSNIKKTFKNDTINYLPKKCSILSKSTASVMSNNATSKLENIEILCKASQETKIDNSDTKETKKVENLFNENIDSLDSLDTTSINTISKIEAHIKSLEKLEYDMLQKVFNMFVDIPNNVAINIPGIRNPSSLPQLKKVRQKIKNKLKVAKTQLLEYQQESSSKFNSSSIKNDILMISDKVDKYDAHAIQESISNNKNLILAEKLCVNKNNTNLSNLTQDYNKFNINKSNTNFNDNDVYCKKLDSNFVIEPKNITKQLINLEPNKLFSSTIDARLKKVTSTVTSNTNSKEIDEISCHVKPTYMNMSTHCYKNQPIHKGQIFNNNLSKTKFNKSDYNHSRELLKVFKNTFGLQHFRPNQFEAINAALLGHNCFILMPTGGGKSLCYQLPAVISRGVTIVISPLKSLIIDQIQKLKSLDIQAAHLLSNITTDEENKVLTNLWEAEPSLKLLYVTPEKVAASNKLIQVLNNLYSRQLLARIVIDEVHCVSQWGHDFRPDYKRLSVFTQNYQSIPIMTLTATATLRVRKDILHQLNIKETEWFISSFNRPNLIYEVISKKGKSTLIDIAKLINSKFQYQSGIIYCMTKKECDNAAMILSREGIKAVSYHAGLSDKKRNDVQMQWTSNKANVVCATIAFGMGIDKSDVRYVIHFSLPQSIEAYYQESGRAGRDGDVAYCLLYYLYSDMNRMQKLIQIGTGATYETKKVRLHNLCKIVSYCENKTDCRRVLQLNYFDEQFDRSQCIANEETTCDNCRKKLFTDLNPNKNSIANETFSCINSINKEIETKCYEDLIDICRGLAASLDINISDVMPLHALRLMSQLMPENEDDLLKIDGVTKSNVEKFGQLLLEIIQKASTEKLAIIHTENKSNNHYADKNCEGKFDDTLCYENMVKRMMEIKPLRGRKRKAKPFTKKNKQIKRRKTKKKYTSKSSSTLTMAKIRNTALKLSAKLRPTRKPGFLSVPKHPSL